MGKIISLLLVLLLAFLSWWFQEDWKKPLLLPTQQDQHFPDYFMEDFTLTRMNEDGKVSHILSAQYMQHYNDTGVIDIRQPEIIFKQNGMQWKISAQRAETRDDSPQIYLYEQVQLQRQNQQQQTDLRILTDYLEFDSRSRIAQTDRPAQIITPDTELHSVGMLIDHDKGILKLNSQVKGRYARRYFTAH